MFKTKPLFFKRILCSKILFNFFIIIFIFTLIPLGREIAYRLSFKKRLEQKQEQIQILENKNQSLIDELLKQKTKYYKERQARLKFGLSRPGEKVIVILKHNNEEKINVNSNYFKKKISNFKLWFKYFFHN